MMIPIPQAGILRRVEGVLAAGKVPYIEEVVIHVREGYERAPPAGEFELPGIYFCARAERRAGGSGATCGARLPARGGDAVVEGG
jgi:hypothetical protein